MQSPPTASRYNFLPSGPGAAPVIAKRTTTQTRTKGDLEHQASKAAAAPARVLGTAQLLLVTPCPRTACAAQHSLFPKPTFLQLKPAGSSLIHLDSVSPCHSFWHTKCGAWCPTRGQWRCVWPSWTAARLLEDSGAAELRLDAGGEAFSGSTKVVLATGLPAATVAGKQV